MALEEVKEKPLAIIIKGNPKYLDDPKVSAMAKRFYSSIRKILVNKGYRVEYDPGEPMTSPKDGASVWIGHSRGIDRLRFAPRGVKTIALTTNDTHSSHLDNDRTGHDPAHYELSEKDIKALNALPSFKG